MANLSLGISVYAGDNPDAPFLEQANKTSTKTSPETNELISKLFAAKKAFSAEFNEESFEALIKDSLKDKEIPEACLLGFAVYEGDTPTIITHKLKAGENECALPFNMSFRGTFDVAKSSISKTKLRSPSKYGAIESSILIESFNVSKEFIILQSKVLPVFYQNETLFIKIVVFTYNKS